MDPMDISDHFWLGMAIYLNWCRISCINSIGHLKKCHLIATLLLGHYHLSSVQNLCIPIYPGSIISYIQQIISNNQGPLVTARVLQFLVLQIHPPKKVPGFLGLLTFFLCRKILVKFWLRKKQDKNPRKPCSAILFYQFMSLWLVHLPPP